MESRQKILVTGANGQLGKTFQLLKTSYPNYSFQFHDRQTLNITDPGQVKQLIEEQRPAFLINCAAYTAVDLAEKEEEVAFQINATAVGKLAAACTAVDCKFIHISTDYVFDGSAKQPYKETDEVAPLNVYGASKLAGERTAIENCPDSIIIRTSWVYAQTGKNFVRTMIRLMSEKETISVVNDQFGSPTYTNDLAEMIMIMIEQKSWHPGIYNFSNDGIISWYDFAIEIKKLIGSNCIVKGIPSSEYPTPAARPAYSGLDKSKVKTVFGIELKPWKLSLANCISEIDSKS